MIEITTPVGRLVGGHPMVQHQVIDENTKQPKLDSSGQPQMQTYIGLAIPKGQETDWKQTPWGQAIYQEAVNSWPNGEYQMPTFAWKVVDGDSAVPNRRGNKPCDREGYPGHWIINASSFFTIKCYNRGQYEPHQAIQRKEAIKPGDYCRMVINVKGNNPSQSPGVYVNPDLFELYQAGQEIVLSTGPSAAETFGATEAALPAGAIVDTNVQQLQSDLPPANSGAPMPNVQTPPPVQQQQQAMPGQGAQTPPPPVQPHPEILNGPVSRNLNGQVYTEDALRGAGYTDEQINALPLA